MCALKQSQGIVGVQFQIWNVGEPEPCFSTGSVLAGHCEAQRGAVSQNRNLLLKPQRLGSLKMTDTSGSRGAGSRNG